MLHALLFHPRGATSIQFEAISLLEIRLPMTIACLHARQIILYALIALLTISLSLSLRKLNFQRNLQHQRGFIIQFSIFQLILFWI